MKKYTEIRTGIIFIILEIKLWNMDTHISRLNNKTTKNIHTIKHRNKLFHHILSLIFI